MKEQTDKTLQQKAVLCIVDSHCEYIADAITTTEDYFIHDEGCDPISTFDPSDEDDKLEDYEILKSGHVFLSNE